MTQEEREFVYYRENGICEVCGNHVPLHEFQAAHRIMKTKGAHKKGTISQVKKRWWKLYMINLNTTQAEKILDHPFNLACTCSLRCNGSVLITNNKEQSNKLLTAIYKDIM